MRDCDYCGEPPLIEGACYDCARCCSNCAAGPHHPTEGVPETAPPGQWTCNACLRLMQP